MPHRPHLIDTTLFFSATSGGVRRYLLEKHRWLNQHSFLRHTLVVPGARTGGTVGEIVCFRSPLIPFGGGYRAPWRMLGLRDLLTGLHPDLIEAGDPYHVGWQAFRAAESLGIPSVAFCHSDLISLFEGRFGRLTGALVKRYVAALYSNFDLVLAPSRVVAGRLHDAGVEHVHVQPLGVDADTFHPARARPELRASLNLPEDTRLLVFAGRLAPEKNLGDLYAMIEALGAPYHLLVIGGSEAERPSPRITVLPYQGEPRELAAWFAGCDALVHAGRCETFGLVALEALACGLPVVVYDAGALPEIVDDSVGAVARGRTPSALAEAVTALFERDQAPIKAAARQRVVAQYTWDQIFTQQIRTYAQLLQRSTLLLDEAEWQPA